MADLPTPHPETTPMTPTATLAAEVLSLRARLAHSQQTAQIQVDVWGGDLHQALVESHVCSSWAEASRIIESQCEAGQLVNVLCLDFKAPAHRQDAVDAAFRALAAKGGA